MVRGLQEPAASLHAVQDAVIAVVVTHVLLLPPDLQVLRHGAAADAFSWFFPLNRSILLTRSLFVSKSAQICAVTKS